MPDMRPRIRSAPRAVAARPPFTYTDQGQLESLAYPVWHGSGGLHWPQTGRTFTYNLDTLSRPISLTDEAQTALVSGVSYGGPSGQLSALSYSGYNETRLYNVRGQLTRLTATGDGLPSVDLEYRFSATNNDGRITQMEDWVSGEEVNYQYDSLGRLTLAETTGPQWGQSFSYDGFGNLTDETATKGTAPTVHRNYDPATNRLTLDYAYDANGNMTAMPGLGMTYNVENRLTQATSNLNGTENYGYDAAGLRLWKQGPDGVIHVYYNGLNGKPLADFYYSTEEEQVQGGDPMVYFAGKRVDNSSVEDRLGTAVVENGQDRMAYFPYGEQRSGASTDVQFATYKRDSVTNLDYAHHRYFSSQIARFTTPDPYDGSASAEAPESWNRYAYTEGDPVNRNDPEGLFIRCPDGTSPGVGSCIPNSWRFDTVFEIGSIGRLNSDGQSDRLAASAELRNLQRRWDAANATTAALRQSLAAFLDTLTDSNCAKVLNDWKGYTIKDLQFLAGNITYFNTSGQEGQLNLSDVMPEGTYGLSDAGDTLNTVLAKGMVGDDALAITLTVDSNVTAIQGPLPDVLLPFPEAPQSVLWHEFWHGGLQLTDEDAVREFKIPKADGQSDSVALENWLSRDCGAGK